MYVLSTIQTKCKYFSGEDTEMEEGLDVNKETHCEAVLMENLLKKT